MKRVSENPTVHCIPPLGVISTPSYDNPTEWKHSTPPENWRLLIMDAITADVQPQHTRLRWRSGRDVCLFTVRKARFLTVFTWALNKICKKIRISKSLGLSLHRQWKGWRKFECLSKELSYFWLWFHYFLPLGNGRHKLVKAMHGDSNPNFFAKWPFPGLQQHRAAITKPTPLVVSL
jgi:hypothetical protein